MSALLSGYTGDLATTPEGKGWVMKALHPADPITDCRGLPDEESCPSVLIAYNMVFRISPPVGATSWSFDLTAMPDVVAPGFIRVMNQAGEITSSFNFLNQALTPPGVAAPSYSQLLTQFRGLGIEAHRLAYMGVTSYQDGPALADQGTLVASQYQVARKKYYVNSYSLTPYPDFIAGTRRFVCYQDNDLANYARSQYLPNAYFGTSKAGCYLPLRLSGNHKWITEADLELFALASPGGEGIGDNICSIPLGVPTANVPPYPSARSIMIDPAGGAYLTGDSVFRPMNNVWGAISAVNLSPSTSFAFYVRMGIECRVTPTSSLASQVHMSPMYDPMAIAAYTRISRELKDGYPADFNDLGKILNIIKSVARVVLPGISMMGPYGAAAGAGGSALLGLLDTFQTKSSGRGEANAPPAATRERIQEARKQIASTFSKKKKKKTAKKAARR